MRFLQLGLLLAAGLGASVALAEEPKWTPEQLQFFESKVRPVLVESCQKCHGGEKVEAGVAVNSRKAFVEGGDVGPLVDFEHPEKSYLLEVTRYDGFVQMPPEGKLPDESIAVLDRWIRMGAPWPEDSAVEAKLPSGLSPGSPEGVAEARKTMWSLQPITNPSVPEVRTANYSRTPIDNFALAKLESQGLTPSPEADRRTLLKRVMIDLHGLPPTPEQLADFEADPRPTAEALDELVARLLDEPAYGERWARHWLDVARYSDTKGYVFQEERSYPFAYTYRDYVIDAFNDDKPFDQFIIEQLAADQLDLGEDNSALAAMGYLTLGRRFLNNTHDIIDDRIDVVGRGLLGLTVSCARCHDHKFDPIPTADYYSLYGVFASSREPDELPLLEDPTKTESGKRFLAELEKKKRALADYIASEHHKMQADVRKRVGDYLLATAEWPDAEKSGTSKRDFAQNRKLIQRTLERWQRRLDKPDLDRDSLFGPWHRFAKVGKDAFAEKTAELSTEIAADEHYHPAVRKLVETPPESLAALAGRYQELFAGIEAKWQEALKAGEPNALPDANDEALRLAIYGENTPTNIPFEETEQLFDRAQRDGARRLQVQIDRQHKASNAPARAMVLVDRDAPVEPVIFRRGNPGNRGDRVTRHFLTAIDAEAKPFGKSSGRLELAQKIASRDNPLTARVIVNRVWAWHFGRGLVATASDFGRQGEPPSHPELLDWLAWNFMENGWSLKWLHREIMASRIYQQQSHLRPDCQAVDVENRLLWRFPRQRLDFEAMRDSILAVSGGLDRTLGGQPVDITNTPSARRRSIYGLIDRQNLPGLFRTFDLASPDSSSPGRYTTTVPQQALFLINSPFIQEQAERLILRDDVKSVSNPAERVRKLYELLYLREPSDEELQLATSFVTPKAPSGDAAPRWMYGYGTFDAEANRVTAFTPFPYYGQGNWRGSAALPDPKLGWLLLSPTGGHPGEGKDRMVIRRWTAPSDGHVSVSGTLKHPETNGDGVRGRVVSSRSGDLGHWEVHNSESPTEIKDIQVQAGDTLDFVVDMKASVHYDGFRWIPVLSFSGDKSQQVFHAQNDFTGSEQATDSFNRWSQFAQVLLISNEFLTVD